MDYRQEYLDGEAEDEAVVLSVSEPVEAPTGTHTGALLTRDTTPLEPEIAELKFYARGVGPVLVLQSSGGASREALVETTRGRLTVSAARRRGCRGRGGRRGSASARGGTRRADPPRCRWRRRRPA